MNNTNLRRVSLEGIETDSTVLILTIVQLCYGLPTIALMIFFLVVLGCRKSYSNSFYRLVQLDLFTNIFCYLNTWLAIRLTKIPIGIVFLKEVEYLVPGLITWSRYMTSWFMHMQFCSAAALSIHRITAVFFHSNYEAIWSRYYPVYGLVCSIYSALQELILPAKNSYVTIENNVLTLLVDTERSNTSQFLIAIFSIGYFVIFSGINTATYLLVTGILNSLNLTDNGIGKKLTKIAVTSSVIYLGILVWSVTSALNNMFNFFTNTVVTSCSLLTFASDLMTLSMPYILLAFDSNVQNDFCKRCKAHNEQVRVSPASSPD